MDYPIEQRERGIADIGYRASSGAGIGQRGIERRALGFGHSVLGIEHQASRHGPPHRTPATRARATRAPGNVASGPTDRTPCVTTLVIRVGHHASGIATPRTACRHIEQSGSGITESGIAHRALPRCAPRIAHQPSPHQPFLIGVLPGSAAYFYPLPARASLSNSASRTGRRAPIQNLAHSPQSYSAPAPQLYGFALTG